jgi:hypothetical protein
VSYGPPKFAHLAKQRLARGAAPVVLDILFVQQFSEKTSSSLFRLFSSKKCPKNTPWFLKAVLGTSRPIRIWFYIRRKLSSAEETGSRKLAMKKKLIF